jgi:hypothetical protein
MNTEEKRLKLQKKKAVLPAKCLRLLKHSKSVSENVYKL